MPLSPRSTRSRAATTTTSTTTTTIVPTPLDPQYSSSSPSTSSASLRPNSPRSILNPHSHFGRSKSSSAATDMMMASGASGSSSQQQQQYQTAASSSSTLLSSSSMSSNPSAPTLNLAALNALDANGGGLGSPSSSASKRGRSSSILSIHEIKENYDDALDQSAMANLNADWVNYKGAWLIHIVLIVIGKILVDSIPGIEQDTSWTIVLQGYLLATYIMFHFVEGVPFESNSGVWDRLTMWEQIDGGEQYTPAKKWLTSLPICLFLLSTHYTRYDRHPALFSLNLISLVALALIPKLPQLHRQRLSFGPGPKSFHHGGDISTGANTPVEISMQRAHLPSLPE